MRWRIGARTFDFSREVTVMAIINRTPDSFFDQGSTFELDRAVDAAIVGAASAYVDRQVNIGDMLEVSAPRGSFTLEPGERPLVLASAGISITPVLAILHELAAERSTQEIWWLFGVRNGKHHPFALGVARTGAPLVSWMEPNLAQQTDSRGIDSARISMPPVI